MLNKMAELEIVELHRLSELQTYNLCATDGEIGPLEDLSFEDSTWTVRYIVANTDTWLDGRAILISSVAIGGIDKDNNEIFVEISRHQIKGSPPIESVNRITRQYEADYFRYYGWPPYWKSTPVSSRFLTDEIDESYTGTKRRRPVNNHIRSASEIMGYNIAAQDGEIGKVTNFVIDEKNWAICYLEIDTIGWWPGKHVLLNPAWITMIDWPMKNVIVDLDRRAIRSAPAYDPKSVISRNYEIKLFEHYGRHKYWE